MKFSTAIPGLSRFKPSYDPWMGEMTSADFQAMCRRLEAMGYEALESSEHLALDKALERNMGGYWPHSIAAISFFAGATTTARVNTRVTVLPLHYPVNLAKALSTLDVLSGGRVSMTVGLGHGEPEFRALGVPYEARGRLADEYLAAMRILWTAEDPVFDGEFVKFRDVVFEPKPIQPGGIPIWIGGNSKPAVRRAVKFGHGWRPWSVAVEDLPRWWEMIEAMPDYRRRARPLELQLPVTTHQVDEESHKPLDGADGRAPEMSSAELVDRIGRMAELGVTWATLPHLAARSQAEYLDRMEAQAMEVIAPTRR